MTRTALIILAIAACTSPAAARCAHCPPPYRHWYYSYPGDQVRRQDLYRFGPPELGGYRFGGRGPDGKYMNDTVYKD
jgi:hypothetical protein